jgi:hypothetical protein
LISSWRHFEGSRLCVVRADEIIDRFAYVGDKAGSLERLAAQNAKPTFNLVKPRSMGWGKVKMDVRMALEPAVVFGLVGIEIVENDVNFFFIAVSVDDALHEIQELPKGLENVEKRIALKVTSVLDQPFPAGL